MFDSITMIYFFLFLLPQSQNDDVSKVQWSKFPGIASQDYNSTNVLYMVNVFAFKISMAFKGPTNVVIAYSTIAVDIASFGL